MVLQIQSIPNGTSFWQIYQGSRNQVSKIWEVSEYLGNGNYKCKAISDNTVGRLNPLYTENFSEDQIRRILADVPILSKTTV